MDSLSDSASQKNFTGRNTQDRVSYPYVSQPYESHSVYLTETRHPHEMYMATGSSQIVTQNQISCKSNREIAGNASQNRYVHKGTNTDIVEDTGPKCKYCMIRMAKLRELEEKKPSKSSARSRTTSIELTYSQSHVSKLLVSRGCQTSASLCSQAPMTPREIRCFMLVLRYRNGKPLRTETYCSCVLHGREEECTCGEDDRVFEWLWDPNNRGDAAYVQQGGRVVMFHKDYSCGTAAICGQRRMKRDQYFWEVKMTTPVYGTDMMIGVGTSGVDLNGYHREFCSMLGTDNDSWGFSYDGRVQHDGRKKEYCGRYGQGAIVGVHLDMWHGTMAFFKNRRNLGVAFSGLRGRTLYPMACSTAARSAMKIVSSRSFPSSLQYLCCRQLRKLVPSHLGVLDVLNMPPGLRVFLDNNLGWLLQVPPQQNSNSSSSSSSSSNYICPICLPLRNVFEGYTDDEGDSSDGDHIHNGFNLLDSEDEEDSEESEAETAFGSGLQSSCRTQHSLVQRVRTHSSTSLPSPILHSGGSSNTSLSLKRPRLDLSSSISTEDEEENSESEDSILQKNGDAPSLDRRESMEEDSSSPRKSMLGKRKKSQR